MILRTFWVWHKAEQGPDCETAWTQWTVDDHPEGWEKAKQDVLDRYGDNVHSTREIEISVDQDAVLKHWWPDPIESEVKAQ